MSAQPLADVGFAGPCWLIPTKPLALVLAGTSTTAVARAQREVRMQVMLLTSNFRLWASNAAFIQTVRVKFPELRGEPARKCGVKMTLPTWPHYITLALPPWEWQ